MNQAASQAMGAEGATQRVRLYVWQQPVRITHWVTAAAIVVLCLTGLYIADPFLLPPGWQVMTYVRLIHIWSAFALLLSGLGFFAYR